MHQSRLYKPEDEEDVLDQKTLSESVGKREGHATWFGE